MDTDERTCKKLILTALEEAAVAVSDQLEVDHDTKRVLGSRNIVDIIAEKIEAASVFVGDVTLTGKTVKPSGEVKFQINSNVATELGYALGTHTDREMDKEGAELVVKVMNVHYADETKLPFDVRERHPVTYDLQPDASKSDLRKARKYLVKQLIPILGGYYERWVSHPSRRPADFVPTPTTLHDGAYWASEETLVTETGDFENTIPKNYTYPDNQAFIYLRLSPLEEMEPFKLNSLTDLNATKPFMQSSGEFSLERNRYGRIWFSTLDGRTLHSITQIFKSREIWGVVPWSYKNNEDDAYLTLPSKWFISEFEKTLDQYSNLAKIYLGYRKANIVAGIVNIRERCALSIPSDKYYYSSPRLIHNDIKTESTIDLTLDAEVPEFRGRFFSEIFDAAGLDFE